MYAVCQIVTLPPKGKDKQADAAVAQGKIRQVSVIDLDGNRVGRTKGVPYRNWTKEEYPDMKRAERRAKNSWRWDTPSRAL